MIYSKQSGKGKAVVLIHGFCETHSIWDNIAPKLSESYHITNLDLPGFGYSDLVAQKITIDMVGQAVHEHLRYLGIDNCVIIGHSLGGYVALSIAEKYPNFLNGIGLFHSTAFSDPDEKRLNREKSMAFIDKYGVEQFTNSFIPTLFADSNHPAIQDLLISAAKTPTPTVLKYTEAMMNRINRTETLTNFNKPILIIAGTEDTAVSIEDSELQAKMNSKCQFEKIVGIGHMGMLESPELCLEKIDKFLSNCYLSQ